MKAFLALIFSFAIIVPQVSFADSNEEQAIAMHNMHLAIGLAKFKKLEKDCQSVTSQEACLAKDKYCIWNEEKCEVDEKTIAREINTANFVMLGVMGAAAMTLMAIPMLGHYLGR